MPSPSVYLAGPITNLSYDDATDWREYCKRSLAEHGITALSPLRGKQYLGGEVNIADKYDKFVLSTERAINARDFYDVTNRDVLLVNLLNAKRVSIGTVMEIAWAFAARKLVVVVMEENNNLHDHSMIRQCTDYRVTNLDEALAVVRSILLP